MAPGQQAVQRASPPSDPASAPATPSNNTKRITNPVRTQQSSQPNADIIPPGCCGCAASPMLSLSVWLVRVKRSVAMISVDVTSCQRG